MALHDHVDSEISITNSRLEAVGFGIPMILPVSVPAGFTDLSRPYSSTDEMIADGFTSADLAYVEAANIERQKPHPPTWRIGKRSTAVAQVLTLTIDTGVNGHSYSIEINDSVNTETFTHVASGTDIPTIAAALRTLVNASSYIGVTAGGSGANITLTADTAGIPFTLSESSANMSFVVTTANVGIPEDLIAISDYSDDWYGLVITQRDTPHIMTAAAAIEARVKLFFAQSNESTILSAAYATPVTSASDVATRLKALAYDRTALWYTGSNTEAFAVAFLAGGLAALPGSRTWKFKSQTGVTATRLTTAQRTNLTSKNANGYEPVAGRNISYNGTVASGEFIDIIHGTDALNARIQELGLAAQLKNPKIEYTDDGIGILGGCVVSALEEFSRPSQRLIARSRRNAETGEVETPAYTVTLPQAVDIPENDKAERELPSTYPIEWEATLAGAIHKAAWRGRVSV